MAVRLQEVHPAIVHYPLALLPVAVGADLLGRATGSEALASVGRTLMPVAAASAILSAVSGLVAQEEVQADGEAADLLVTHRTINLGLVTLSTALAVHRVRDKEPPGAGYFALALAGLGALAYSAYLGGKMVYQHGLGVEPADGLRHDASPELSASNARRIARRVGEDVERGIAHAIEDYRHGDVLPALGHRHDAPGARPAVGAPGATNGDGDAAGAPETIP